MLALNQIGSQILANQFKTKRKVAGVSGNVFSIGELPHLDHVTEIFFTLSKLTMFDETI